MIFLNPIVISQKIQHKGSLLKVKSFAASFGIHAILLSSILYLMTIHPIPLAKEEKIIAISLTDFASTSGDINRIEQQPKSIHQPIVKSQPQIKPIPQQPLITTTPERIVTKQPPLSPEASAPLAIPQAISPSPSIIDVHDSPKITTSTPEKELPRAPISENKIDGSALGHIRAMIENAITYPSIAKKLRLEGVVLVCFTLKSDGTVETAHVKSTSGSNILDNKAIQTILSLSGDYPALGKTFELSIPIAFNLHKS